MNTTSLLVELSETDNDAVSALLALFIRPSNEREPDDWAQWALRCSNFWEDVLLRVAAASALRAAESVTYRAPSPPSGP
jgi:hypothetical protein